ncbi:methyltransferase domain-containing protein [Corynebacterium sp. 3HC-13]|uniref:class I SAM-dependent DNA methyltransferase n=1 Tax=Corynebacterium poyangense TaxID=2684405 RepID=UPI001CC98395|nr:class I SAM-dependent methyltransferase [Corynebacterium poyangense]MBZ8177746.1 methyltransferase domain-containing protein [Corynebacterium poyangense]
MPTWKQILEKNPQHSHTYAARWRRFAEEGRDIDGEARLIDAMVPRGAVILDAGCGTGRVGGYLAKRGHHVTGTDIDEVLLNHARHDFPETHWVQSDLGKDPQPSGPYDLIVLAGNVVSFIAPEDRRAMFAHLREVLAPHGRCVVGYGAGRGWDFEDFLGTAKESGFIAQHLFSSWDLAPWNSNSSFLVAVLALERSDASGTENLASGFSLLS